MIESKMKTYLSVDIDYWMDAKFPCPFIHRVLAMARRLPSIVVNEHHHLLPHINSFMCPKLINVDWHSDATDGDDVGGPTAIDIECGSWVNFVRGQKRLFRWYYPSAMCVQTTRCNNHPRSGFCNADPDTNPFYAKDPRPICGWHQVAMRQGLPTNQELADVVAIGFALSRGWYYGEKTDKEVILPFLRLCHHQGLKVSRVRIKDLGAMPR